jgi:acyl-CoA synthetase (AMP-forming)/AMP-acid ligase II
MDWRDEPRPHEVLGPIDITPTLPNAIRRGVEKFGDLLFMIDGERRLSFAEVDRQSAALARGLLAMGLGKGSRVAIMMPDGADWVLAWFAAARIGALAVGFSTLYQRREIAWALKHNDIDTLLVSAKYLHHDYQARIEEAVPGLAGQSAERPLYLPSHPYLRRVVVWGGETRPWAQRGPDAILARAAATPEIDAAFLAQIESNVTPADELIIICTSGTTAEPKAVVHTHGAGLRNTWAFSPYTEFTRGEKVFNGLPFFWVGGLLRGIMPALFAGSCMVFPKSPSGEDLLDVIRREQVSVIYPGGAQMHALRAAVAAHDPDLSFIREGLGPAVDRDTRQPIPPEQRVGGSLGMTETFGTHSTDALDRAAPPGKAKNWGRPMPGVERRIVSLETGEPLPPGEVGELQLRGLNLMRGYYKRERHEAFTPDGYFPTGDRCMIDEDDFLFFYGRINDMIKTAGANVAPAEVEAVLYGYPEVREAIVFGVRDAARGEAVAAVVVPQDGCEVDTAELRRKVRQEISSYKAPQIILTMDWADVPRTDAAGKPKRVVLREMVEREREKSPAFGQ